MSKVGQQVTLPENAYYSGAATEGPPNFGAMSDGVSYILPIYQLFVDYNHLNQV